MPNTGQKVARATPRGVRRAGTTRAAQAAALLMGLCLASGAALAQPAPAKPAPAAPGKPAPAAPGKPAPAAPGAPAAEAAPAADAPQPLSESLTGMAKAEYGAGVALYKDNDFAGALTRFERAHELSHDHRLLWNVALCQKNLRRYVDLLATAKQLEQEGGAALSDQDRQDLADLVKAAEALVSRIEVRVSEPGATVLIDDKPVGTAPLAAPVVVDIGERKIRVTKPGFDEYVRTERVVGGGAVTVEATLKKSVHRGRLVVVAGPDDLIALDGKAVGRARWEGVVTSGTHAMRITAPGMEAHQSDVLVRDDEVRRIQITLTPEPRADATTRWLWIGGGAALLAGAAILGVVLFQPSPPSEQGSLGSVSLSFGGKR